MTAALALADRLARLERTVATLQEQQAGGEALQPTYLTVDAQGHVSANFSGKVTAAGVVFPAFTSTPSATTSQIEWLRASDNAVLADIEAGEDVPTTGQQTQMFLVAESPDVVGNPIAGLKLAANLATTGQFVEAFANGIEVVVLRGDGGSSFLQLLSAQQLQIDHGTGAWTWPGANTTSNLATINHGLGRTPIIVIPIPNQDQGGGAGTLISFSVSGKTTTQFSTRAGFQTLVPGAGATATFDWIAIG